MTSPLIEVHDQEPSYEVLYSAGWRWRRWGRTNLFGSTLRSASTRFRQCFWRIISINQTSFSSVHTAGKALGREALRTGGKILTDIADNPQTGYKEIISKHVQNTIQNLGSKMTGRGCKRKRQSKSHITRESKNPDVHLRVHAQPEKTYTQTRRY